MKNEDKRTNLQEVTLKKEHEHGGIKHAIGAKIMVTPEQKKRLAERGKV